MTEDEMTGDDMTGPRVRHLRVVVEAADYAEAVRFYRDVLGMDEEAAFAGEADDRVAILLAGSASLEIASPRHREIIDDIEAGGQPSPRIRLAFEVDDAAAVTRDLADAGATVVAEPVLTPWQSLNARLDAPAGLQVTVYQELESREEREARDGFATDADRP